MSLRERIDADLKAALKAREAGKARLSVLRLVKAAVRNTEIARGHALGEEELVEVVARELKARRDVLPEYLRSGREELVAQLQEEIAILQEYLPAALSEEELRAACQEEIAAQGAVGPRDIGRVMGPLMRRLRGRADGDAVRRMVEELLRQAAAERG